MYKGGRAPNWLLQKRLEATAEIETRMARGWSDCDHLLCEWATSGAARLSAIKCGSATRVGAHKSIVIFGIAEFRSKKERGEIGGRE